MCVKIRNFFLFLKQLGFLFAFLKHRKYQRGMLRLYKFFIQRLRITSCFTQFLFTISGKFNRRPRAKTFYISRNLNRKPGVNCISLRINYAAYELKTFFGTYFLKL